VLPGQWVTLDIAAVGTDERQRHVLPSRFRFEVRARSAEAQAELLRREALREYLKGDYAAAESTIAALLQEHPNSFEAYVIRGDVLKAQGKGADASRAYERALALVAAGADARYVGRANPAQVEDAVGALKVKIAQSQR
jgi:predicted Zn-dependent protease